MYTISLRHFTSQKKSRDIRLKTAETFLHKYNKNRTNLIFKLYIVNRNADNL